MNRSAMKRRFAVLSLLLFVGTVCGSIADARVFQQALPGYKFNFPADHASHDQFKTEWWYYTGHLNSTTAGRFGYELTFFRTGVDDPAISKTGWDVDNFYIAHFALSDETNHKFLFFEKMNRPGLKTADASKDHYCVFNENWSVEQLGDSFVLKADAPDIALHLILKSLKPPVVHGVNGVSQKASCRGCASHYYSLTHLQSQGVLNIHGKALPVTGLSWMDHEFGSNQLTKEQVGWDWFSLQLDDNSELMIYLMRKTKGDLDANSSGSLVRADGTVKHLTLADFKIKATGSWKSPKTGGTYPMGWTVEIPSEKLTATVTPSFPDQELNTKKTSGVTYWEGTAAVDGTKDKRKVTGQAYVEMTGYAERFGKNI